MNIKKLIAGAVAGAAILATSMPILAAVQRVPGPWQLTAPNGIAFGCGGGTYNHTLNDVSNYPDGSFDGTGTYDPDNSYTWDMTGAISDDSINFTITYTGTGAGAVYNATGAIAPNGSISGTVDSNCQTFTMAAGSASKFEGNHGQWVKMSDDKKGAAQSRVGMPVQSKGH